MSLTPMQLAAIAQFEADLALMSLPKLRRELEDTLNQIDELEPWAEALTARIQQLEEQEKTE